MSLTLCGVCFRALWVGLVEVGHLLLAKDLKAKDYA